MPEPTAHRNSTPHKAVGWTFVGRLGLEPRTNGLKVHCSAIELEGLGSGSLRDAGGVSTMSGMTAVAPKSTASTPLLHITPLLASLSKLADDAVGCG
jgi:hypothetical protein